MNIRGELKRFLIYGFGTISGSALNFLLIPLYLSKYNTAEYGVINILLMFITFSSIFVSAGMMSAMQKQYFDVSVDDRKVVVGTIIIWYVVILCFVGILLIIFRGSISNLFFDSREYTREVGIVPFIVLFTLLFDIPLNLLRLKKKAKQFVFLALFRLLIEAALKYLFIVPLNRGISGYFEASFISLLIANILGYVFVTKDITLRFNKNIYVSLLQISSPYIITGFTIWSLQWVDRIMLNFLLSESATGIYSLGVRFGQIYNIIFYRPFSVLLPAIIFPLLKERGDDDIRRLFSRLLNFLVVVGSVLTGIIIFFSLGAVDVLNSYFDIDPNYIKAKSVIPWLILSNMLYSFAIPAGYIGLHLRKTKMAAYSGLVAAGSNIVLNWFFINAFGIVGAALATFLSFFIYLLCVYLLLNRLFVIRYHLLGVTGQLLILTAVLSIGITVQFDNIIISIFLKVIIVAVLLLISAWIPNRIIDIEFLDMVRKRVFKSSR